MSVCVCVSCYQVRDYDFGEYVIPSGRVSGSLLTPCGCTDGQEQANHTQVN